MANTALYGGHAHFYLETDDEESKPTATAVSKSLLPSGSLNIESGLATDKVRSAEKSSKSHANRHPAVPPLDDRDTWDSDTDTQQDDFVKDAELACARSATFDSQPRPDSTSPDRHQTLNGCDESEELSRHPEFRKISRPSSNDEASRSLELDAELATLKKFLITTENKIKSASLNGKLKCQLDQQLQEEFEKRKQQWQTKKCSYLAAVIAAEEAELSELVELKAVGKEVVASAKAVANSLTRAKTTELLVVAQLASVKELLAKLEGMCSRRVLAYRVLIFVTGFFLGRAFG